MTKFVFKKPLKEIKKIRHSNYYNNVAENNDILDVVEKEEVNTNEIENKENKNKEEVMMTTQEKINAAANVLSGNEGAVKRVKRDRGLIERTESSKVILTEDNKELLKD